jgi:hypothetical protein
MRHLVKAIALLGIAVLTGCAPAAIYDKTSVAAVKRIAIEQPADPAGVVPSIDPQIAALATGEPTPDRSIPSVLVGGLAQALGDKLVTNQAKKFPQPNRNSFLADRGVKIGALLADDMRIALAAEGYTVVAANDPADAVLSFGIDQLGYGLGPDEKWHPYAKITLFLKNSGAKTPVFQHTYHYAVAALQGTGDDGIEPDPRYSGDSATMFADNGKLLFDGLRVSIEKIVARAALALKPN